MIFPLLNAVGYLLHVAVAHWRICLLLVDDCIGYLIKQRLSPLIPNVQDALTTNTIMDGKTDTYYRQVFFAGKGISF